MAIGGAWIHASVQCAACDAHAVLAAIEAVGATAA